MAAAPAKRDSWQNKPMPPARAKLTYERGFTAEEHRRLALGLVPRNMDDKWFIFLDDGWLNLHRSWTGVCIYAVRLVPAGEGSEVAEAWANRAPEEYTRTDDAYDARMLGFLVDRLLLGKDAPFPVPEAISGGDQTALYRQHVVGHERTSDDDGESGPLN